MFRNSSQYQTSYNIASLWYASSWKRISHENNKKYVPRNTQAHRANDFEKTFLWLNLRKCCWCTFSLYPFVESLGVILQFINKRCSELIWLIKQFGYSGRRSWVRTKINMTAFCELSTAHKNCPDSFLILLRLRNVFLSKLFLWEMLSMATGVIQFL